MKKVILSAIIGALFGGAVVFATTQTPVCPRKSLGYKTPNEVMAMYNIGFQAA
ncbi:MAG: hypothetical protein IJ881_01510 [Neisseriaceae bacterium]|nr:hypothetical protein [Neisseriaceae bacterium]MBR3425845.1 hypothetical protein [Neisseriaceae bacterium]